VAPLGDFKKNWESLGPEQEVMEHFQLQVRREGGREGRREEGIY